MGGGRTQNLGFTARRCTAVTPLAYAAKGLEDLRLHASACPRFWI